jgi:hypothetical protein
MPPRVACQAYKLDRGWKLVYNISINVTTGVAGDPINDRVVISHDQPSVLSRGGGVHAVLQGDFAPPQSVPALE